MRALILLLTGTCLCAAEPGDDAVKKDLKHYQGTWQAVAANRIDGEPLSAEELKEIKLVVEGDKFTLTSGPQEKPITGTFKLDPSKKPKAIDLFLGAEQKAIPGIYEIVNDDLRKSCFNLKGEERPTEEAKGLSLFRMAKGEERRQTLTGLVSPSRHEHDSARETPVCNPGMSPRTIRRRWNGGR